MKRIVQVGMLVLSIAFSFPAMAGSPVMLSSGEKQGSEVKVTPPPASLNLDPFYKKYLDANGFRSLVHGGSGFGAGPAWQIIVFMTECSGEDRSKNA
jgi:hypothetical protein